MYSEESIVRKNKMLALIKIIIAGIYIPCTNFVIWLVTCYLLMDRLLLPIVFVIAMMATILLDYYMLLGFKSIYKHSDYYIKLALVFVQCLVIVFGLLCILNFFPKNDSGFLSIFANIEDIFTFLGFAILLPLERLITTVFFESNRQIRKLKI